MKDNAPELQIDESIKSLGDAIAKELKVGDGGVITVEKDFYQRHLPENLSIADVQRVQAHDSNFISAVGYALGQVGLKHLAKNKDQNEVSVKFRAGKNAMGLNFARMKTSPNPKGGDPLVRYGVLSAKVQVAGANNNAGSWKQLRSYLSDRGSRELGG